MGGEGWPRVKRCLHVSVQHEGSAGWQTNSPNNFPNVASTRCAFPHNECRAHVVCWNCRARNPNFQTFCTRCVYWILQNRLLVGEGHIVVRRYSSVKTTSPDASNFRVSELALGPPRRFETDLSAFPANPFWVPSTPENGNLSVHSGFVPGGTLRNRRSKRVRGSRKSHQLKIKNVKKNISLGVIS